LADLFDLIMHERCWRVHIMIFLSVRIQISAAAEDFMLVD
jgi:hypothetical protein